MKKIVYLLLTLLSLTPSTATQNNFSFFSKFLVSIGLSALVSNKEKHGMQKKTSLTLSELDEKQVLSFILDNYLRKAKIKANVPNELKGLIHRFFIDEWTMYGLHKETGTAYDPHDFDIKGIHRKTKHRLDRRGFKQDGYYKRVDSITGKPTKYDPKGYNIERWDKNGLYENGSRVDYNGFVQQVSYASIALHKASKGGDIQAVSLLLKNPDINVNLKDKYGLTPLIWCCGARGKLLHIGKLLLGHPSIDVNLKGFGYTPLMWCCAKGDAFLEIAKALLGHPNIDVNVKCKYGYTALTHCCRNGDKSLEIATALLEHPNIDVNLQDKDDWTALDCIIKRILMSIKHNLKYKYVNLWNVMVAKGAILHKGKKDYQSLNPGKLKKPQRTYVKSIISNPPRDLKMINVSTKVKKHRCFFSLSTRGCS